MPRKADPTKSKQYRIEHGLCPLCGKEAAPYYLCHDHRTGKAFTRILNRMADQHILARDRRRDGNYYSIGAASIDDYVGRPSLFDLKPDDKRLKPRLGRRPVDLDDTLIGIFRDANRPLTMDEIFHAWGRLRSQRKHETLAGDMAAIIKAQRKRDERAAKRLAAMAAP